MVNLESIDPLKVDFRVPEIYSRAGAASASRCQIALDALPGKTLRRQGDRGQSADRRRRPLDRDPRAGAQHRHALRPGMFARVRLITKDVQDALVVPEQALVPQGDEQYVFRVRRRQGGARQGRDRPAPRRQGRDPKGLSTDDVVVTAGQIKLRDGVPVTISRQQPVMRAAKADARATPARRSPGNERRRGVEPAAS